MTTRHEGSKWMTIATTTARWPSNGKGGVTATDTASIVENSKRTLVDGILLLTAHTAATTITIMEQDGSTTVHALTIAANQACPLPIPIGGENGIDVFSGLSAKTSNAATTYVVYFRRADGSPYE